VRRRYGLVSWRIESGEPQLKRRIEYKLVSYNVPIWLEGDEGVAPMPLSDPLWLTALATLVSSLATLVWALRRKI